MEKDLIFFGEQGLTSTSANHIANLAKELIQQYEFELNEVSFFSSRVSLVGKEEEKVVSRGKNTYFIEQVPILLKNIADAKSLIAWLREGIKAKSNILSSINQLRVKDYCDIHGIECPEMPTQEESLTEAEYMSTLSVKDRNKFYMLQTECAVLGSAVHPGGSISNARKALSTKLEHPYVIDGSGRDALIYSYTPTVKLEEVDSLFFNLQKEYREKQAELNGMLHKKDTAITFDENAKKAKYAQEYTDYHQKIQAINAKLEAYKVAEIRKVQEFKIIIPNELRNIYDIVSKLGKEE